MGFNTLPANPYPPSTEQLGAGGGGGSYVLPTASADTLGGVKVGSNLSIADGVLSAPAPYSLPTASAETLGGVKVGANLSIADGVLSAPAPYVLPNASAETLGGVKVGAGLSIDDGVLSASAGGATVKHLEYTGDGGATTPIDFGNDTPAVILGIYPDPNETYAGGDYNSIMSFSWLNKMTLALWSQQNSGDPYGNGGYNMVRMAYNGNVVTLTSGSSRAGCNVEGQKYRVDYIV